MAILQIVRAKRQTLGADHFPGFGTVLRPCEDPDGIDVDAKMLGAIRLDPSMPKIPATLANRISDLYISMMGRQKSDGRFRSVDASKEVSVVLLRDVETMSRWRVLVPTQEVGGASVAADYTKPLCDIETGEEVAVFPPDGWCHAGSSHSHNTMGAFFSGVDNANELPVPGIHFVIGNLRKGKEGGWTFDVAPSIVYHNKRYEAVAMSDGTVKDLHWSDILDFTTEAFGAHENVLNYVTTVKYASTASYSFGRGLGYSDDDYGDGWVARLYGDAGHDRFRAADLAIPEIVEELTHASYFKWLFDFDKQVDAVGYHQRDKMVPAPKSPVLAFGGGEVIKSITDLPHGISSKWALVQSEPGEAKLAIRLCYPVAYEIEGGGNGVAYYMGRTSRGETSYERCVVIHRALLKSYAKRQREETKNVEPADGRIDFETRGVKAHDLTEVEIEKMVEALASTTKSRTTLRIAYHKAMRGYDGGSKR